MRAARIARGGECCLPALREHGAQQGVVATEPRPTITPHHHPPPSQARARQQRKRMDKAKRSVEQAQIPVGYCPNTARLRQRRGNGLKLYGVLQGKLTGMRGSLS